VIPDSHEAGISAPVEQFLGPLVVDLRPGPEGRTANFYFGQNAEGQIIFCYTPKELFLGTNRESLSELLPILANRMISLVVPRHISFHPSNRCNPVFAERLQLLVALGLEEIVVLVPFPWERPTGAVGRDSRWPDLILIRKLKCRDFLF
jgi:hypothetical protein